MTQYDPQPPYITYPGPHGAHPAPHSAYPAPYGGYPGPHGAYPPPPPPPRNGMGTAGFVLGVLGLVVAFIPLVGLIAWPMVIAGIVLSLMGMSRARSDRATNKGLAVAGLACSVIGLLVCIVHTVILAILATAPAEDGGSMISADGPGAIGDEVGDGSFAFTVTDVEWNLQSLGAGPTESVAQGSYVLVHVTVTNVGGQAVSFSEVGQTLLDARGRTFDPEPAVAALSIPDNERILAPIAPGASVDGTLVFDVPDGLTPAAIELHESPASEGVTVELND
ncbi:MAG TPA: DUF4190 domain-containing protein [Pseudonocardia sp.]|nr:DUF4190 domain-containing protein [Pseudonocardia sp.]